MPSVRTLALLGNAAALVLIVLLCGAGDVLYADVDPAPAAVPGPDPVVPVVSSAGSSDASIDAVATAPSPSAPGGASPALRPVLLIVVDGLRLDVSLDADAMPELADLARRGRRTVLTVEALVPSTIAALHAMVEGRRVAPTAALHDFGAAASPDGGTLARLDAAGGRIVVAATHLWAGLYGRFLAPGLAVPGLPDAASDERVFRVAGRALDGPAEERPELVVAHFGALDAAGHRYGGASRAYRAVARRIDALAGRLARRALEDGRAVVFTSDHGTTDAGGHAGGEPVVRRVPLAVAGADLPARLDALAPTLQRELPDLLDAALGLPPAPSVTARTARSTDASDTGVATATRLLAALVACAAGLAVAVTRPVLVADARAATALSATVWLAIGAAVALGPAAGAALGTLVLVAVAVAGGRRSRTAARTGDPDADRRRRDATRAALAASACGAAFAAWAIVDAAFLAGSGAAVAGPVVAFVGAALALLACGPTLRASEAPGPISGPGRTPGGASLVAAAAAAATLGGGLALGGPGLAALAVAALAGGAVTGLASRPVAAGVALALVPAALARAAGDAASLSSIDVALAHRMADTSLGLGAAVATAVARLALLPVAAVVGHALARGLHCDAPGRGAPRGRQGRVGAFDALAATHVGAGLVLAAALGVGGALPDPLAGAIAGAHPGSSADGVPLAAAGLGALLRELDALAWLWLTAAAAIGAGRLAATGRDGRRRVATGVG